MPALAPRPDSTARAAWVRGGLLALWFVASFGVAFFARDLDQVLAGWPLNFWLAAQGSVLVFFVVVVVYAWFMNREDARAAHAAAALGTAAPDKGAGDPR